jgi:Fe-S-cluster containining protein
MAETNSQCKQCGTCCRKGGPILHLADRGILHAGRIRMQHLITIRKGELAYSPVTHDLHPTDRELIKTAGKGDDWSCCFFNDETGGCSIYEHRPLECRLLQCWDTAPLEAVINRDTLARTDIIPPDDPILQLMAYHDQECSCARLLELAAGLGRKTAGPATMAELTELISKDLHLRSRAVAAFELPVSVELFYFGRPLFLLLRPYGITVHEENGTIHLRPA